MCLSDLCFSLAGATDWPELNERSAASHPLYLMQYIHWSGENQESEPPAQVLSCVFITTVTSPMSVVHSNKDTFLSPQQQKVHPQGFSSWLLCSAHKEACDFYSESNTFLDSKSKCAHTCLQTLQCLARAQQVKCKFLTTI